MWDWRTSYIGLSLMGGVSSLLIGCDCGGATCCSGWWWFKSWYGVKTWHHVVIAIWRSDITNCHSSFKCILLSGCYFFKIRILYLVSHRTHLILIIQQFNLILLLAFNTRVNLDLVNLARLCLLYLLHRGALVNNGRFLHVLVSNIDKVLMCHSSFLDTFIWPKWFLYHFDCWRYRLRFKGC